MSGFLLRAGLTAVGLWLASLIFPGLSFDQPSTLIAAALLLGVMNAVIKPLFILLTLPITIVTLGLFLPVINAALLALVAKLLAGFSISGFWTAVGGAFIVSLVSAAATKYASGNHTHFTIYRQ